MLGTRSPSHLNFEDYIYITSKLTQVFSQVSEKVFRDFFFGDIIINYSCIAVYFVLGLFGFIWTV